VAGMFLAGILAVAGPPLAVGTLPDASHYPPAFPMPSDDR
jgi:hypothetical protein